MNNLLLALKKLSYALVTKRCEICGEVIELGSSLCDDCKSLKTISSPKCKSCGCSKDDCTCKKNKNEYKQITAPYYYKDSVVKAVHNFKENDMPFLSNRFCADMLNSVADDYNDIEFDFVTYVPLRKFKQIKRGFNQSQLLADNISKSLNIPCLPLLKKLRYTGVQHHKSARERKAAVYGAYDVADKYKIEINGKTILLIDDVKTTGSTLNECAKMLNIYGVKAVYACAFAITKREKRDSKK